MSNRLRNKTEAGQGGRLGHSNMSHWDGTEVLKANSRRRRRQHAVQEIRTQLQDTFPDEKATQKQATCLRTL